MKWCSKKYTYCDLVNDAGECSLDACQQTKKYKFTIDLTQENLTEDEALDLADAIADCITEAGYINFLIVGDPDDETSEFVN